tara:strand:+ start:228 stop:479 length:252 start_codon:yes stop_codon:yes gene_type:complete
MKLEKGQIIRHCCRFPDKDEYEISRYFVLSVDNDYVTTYLLWHNTDGSTSSEEPGTVDKLLKRCFESESETTNNFYFKIMEFK